MDISKFPEFDNHESVTFFSDKETGLKGIIAIHNTNLGPAAGGTRYWRYHSEDDAIRDVLNLSKAMTYKCALAGVPYGGAKGVIIADPRKPKTEAFLAAYAKQVNLLKGNFITGEDVGMTDRDIDILVKHSKFIVGRKQKAGELGPWAALGVFSAIQGALEEVSGNAEMRNRTFVIKGVGKVGFELCRLIFENGGKLVISDINKEAVKQAQKKFPGAKIVKPAEAHKQECDVFAPCAMGCELSSRTVKELRCKIVCGAANNQLCDAKDGLLLHRLGILYVPDYLANAGGLINVVGEVRKEGYDRKWVETKCKGIKETAKKIIGQSKKYNKPTSEIADRLAEKIFKKAG